jgi:hypothetical protein
LGNVSDDYLRDITMKSFWVLAGSLLLFKGVWATGYSGLNNDLLVIYALFLGLILLIIGARKATRYLKTRLHHSSNSQDHS